MACGEAIAWAAVESRCSKAEGAAVIRRGDPVDVLTITQLFVTNRLITQPECSLRAAKNAWARVRSPWNTSRVIPEPRLVVSPPPARRIPSRKIQITGRRRESRIGEAADADEPRGA